MRERGHFLWIWVRFCGIIHFRLDFCVAQTTLCSLYAVKIPFGGIIKMEIQIERTPFTIYEPLRWIAVAFRCLFVKSASFVRVLQFNLKNAWWALSNIFPLFECMSPEFVLSPQSLTLFGSSFLWFTRQWLGWGKEWTTVRFYANLYSHREMPTK